MKSTKFHEPKPPDFGLWYCMTCYTRAVPYVTCVNIFHLELYSLHHTRLYPISMLLIVLCWPNKHGSKMIPRRPNRGIYLEPYLFGQESTYSKQLSRKTADFHLRRVRETLVNWSIQNGKILSSCPI